MKVKHKVGAKEYDLSYYSLRFYFKPAFGVHNPDKPICYFQLDEKVQQLSDMSNAKPIISLNMAKFKEFVKSPPRDYSFVIMFTAMAPSRRCSICQAVYDEYRIVANSFRFSQAYTDNLFFGIVDFDEGSDMFQMVST